MRQSGDCDQLGEVGLQAFYSSPVPRHDYRHVLLVSVYVANPSGPLQRGGHVVPVPSVSTSSDVAAAALTHVVSEMVSSEGSHSHAAPPVAAERQLVTDGWRPSRSYPIITDLSKSGTVVASSGRQVCHFKFRPHPVIVYRRVPVGLEGTSA